MSIYSTVKKYIRKISEFEPLIRGVMHKHDKQFISNNYDMYIFKTHRQELERLPTIIDKYSYVDFQEIIGDEVANHKLTKYEIAEFENLSNLTNISKSALPKSYKVGSALYNPEYLINLYNLFGGDFANCKRNQVKKNKFLLLENDKLIALINPIRQ